MARKFIIKESVLKKMFAQEILEEANLSKSEIASAVKDALKNDNGVKKDIEKQVKSIVAAAVNTLFKTLWQRRNFYEDEISR